MRGADRRPAGRAHSRARRQSLEAGRTFVRCAQDLIICDIDIKKNLIDEEFLRLLQEKGVDLDAARLTSSKVTVLIDEIQYLANPSSFMKLVADHHRYLRDIGDFSQQIEHLFPLSRI